MSARSGRHLAIGIRDAKPRQGFDLERLHDLRLGFGLVIVAEEVQDAVDNKVRAWSAKVLPSLSASRATVSKASATSPSGCASRRSGWAEAGKESTFVGLSLPRQARLSVANAASSVRSRLISTSSPRGGLSRDRERGLDGAAGQSLGIAERRPALRLDGEIERDHGSRPPLRAGTIAVAASAS